MRRCRQTGGSIETIGPLVAVLLASAMAWSQADEWKESIDAGDNALGQGEGTQADEAYTLPWSGQKSLGIETCGWLETLVDLATVNLTVRRTLSLGRNSSDVSQRLQLERKVSGRLKAFRGVFGQASAHQLFKALGDFRV